MPEDRQWFWTKLVGAVLSLFLLISIAVGVANMHFQLQGEVRDNKASIVEHRVSDEKEWGKAWVEINGNKEAVHSLEIIDAKTEANQKEILRRLDELAAILKQLEIHNGN